MSTKCVSAGNVPNTSRSASSAKLFAVRTNVVRLGNEFARVGWILAILLRARRRVFSRGERGKFPSVWISLSVKSIQSHGYPKYKKSAPNSKSHIEKSKASHEGKRRLTPATPKFSIAGILCPVSKKFDINAARLKV
jgi:hypothetical protein